jgi:hypothetical protein
VLAAWPGATTAAAAAAIEGGTDLMSAANGGGAVSASEIAAAAAAIVSGSTGAAAKPGDVTPRCDPNPALGGFDTYGSGGGVTALRGTVLSTLGGNTEARSEICVSVVSSSLCKSGSVLGGGVVDLSADVPAPSGGGRPELCSGCGVPARTGAKSSVGLSCAEAAFEAGRDRGSCGGFDVACTVACCSACSAKIAAFSASSGGGAIVLGVISATVSSTTRTPGSSAFALPLVGFVCLRAVSPGAGSD